MSRRLIPLVLPLALLPAALAQDSAAAKTYDWPRWRGPRIDSVCREPDLLTEWPASGPKLVWKTTNLGGGYSTPSVAAGRIYGLSYRGRDQVVWALDEASGKELWATRIGPTARGVDRGEGPRSTPTVDGDRLYAVGVGGELVCLSTAGKLLWTVNYKSDLGGEMMSGWGYSESPLVDGDRVIGTPGDADAALAAFDKATGKVVWKAAVPGGGGAGYASVVPVTVGGVKTYVTVLGSKYVGVAAADGKLLWEYTKATNTVANISTPVVRGDTLFVSTAYGAGSAVLKLSAAAGKVTAREVKVLNSRTAQNHHGGMVLVGEHVYFGHGQNQGAPTCVEFATGNLAWQERRSPGQGSAAVLAFANRLIFRYDDGTVALLEASPKAYKLVSKFQQPDRSDAAAWAHPVIANGKLYLRDQGVLLCYEMKKN